MFLAARFLERADIEYITKQLILTMMKVEDTVSGQESIQDFGG